MGGLGSGPGQWTAEIYGELDSGLRRNDAPRRWRGMNCGTGFRPSPN